jgi:hypothetical protein
MERTPNRRFQLGKQSGYLEAWKVNAGAHGQESMNFHPEEYDAGTLPAEHKWRTAKRTSAHFEEI